MKHALIASFFATATLVSFAPIQVRSQEAKNTQPAVAAQTAPVAKQPDAKPATVRVVDSTSDKNEALVSISFDETPLVDVIKAFRDATGANIISSGTNLQGNVSVRLDNVPWRKGLGSVLGPQGLQLIEQPLNSGIFVVTAKTTETIPMITRTFTLENAKAENVADLFKTTLGSNGSRATAFKGANAVIVTATEQQVAECEKIITSVDKSQQQVYIEVRFAELSSGACRKLGVDWTKAFGDLKDDTNKGLVINNSFSDAGNTPWLKYGVNHSSAFGGILTPSDFSVTLKAFEELDGVSVFSNPKIIVANETVATVDMTTKEPNLEITTTRTTQSSGSSLDIAAKLTVVPGEKADKDGLGQGLFAGEAFFSYGISLKVTPRISQSGLITLIAEPSISTLKEYYTFNGVDSSTPTPKYPIINMQRMQTTFSMQSGTTAVIGGLSKSTETTGDTGIPYLYKIPWIGPHLFGWKNREKEQKEIIIFVTVGIADPLNLKEDTGMPKNAILGRGLMSGKTKEPGDRTIEDFMSLKDPARTNATNAKAAAGVTEAKAAVDTAAKPAEKTPVSTAPTAVEPLLKNP